MKHHNPNQIVTKPSLGRNDPCGCGSGLKFKKCCGSATRLANKQLLDWLMLNDLQPPVDYKTITVKDLDDPQTNAILYDRKLDIMQERIDKDAKEAAFRPKQDFTFSRDTSLKAGILTLLALGTKF